MLRSEVNFSSFPAIKFARFFFFFLLFSETNRKRNKNCFYSTKKKRASEAMRERESEAKVIKINFELSHPFLAALLAKRKLELCLKVFDNFCNSINIHYHVEFD